LPSASPIVRRFRRGFCHALLGCAAAACPGRARADTSPFLPAGAGLTAAAASNDAYQFTGVITSASQTLLGFTNTRTRQSCWLAVGGGNNELSVLGYDPASGAARLRIGAETTTLTLRKAAIVDAPNVFFQNPSAPPGTLGFTPLSRSAAALSAAAQEREANALVGDLLTIGIQQRKAYEDAKKKAAEAAAGKKP
jgi:hypothetical protein